MRKNTSVPAIVVARWEANIRYASLPRLNVRLMTLSCSFLISCILCNSLPNYTIALMVLRSSKSCQQTIKAIYLEYFRNRFAKTDSRLARGGLQKGIVLPHPFFALIARKRYFSPKRDYFYPSIKMKFPFFGILFFLRASDYYFKRYYFDYFRNMFIYVK